MSLPLAMVTGKLPLGGSSTFLVNLCRGFAARGLELPVLSLSADNLVRQDFEAVGVRVVSLSEHEMILEDRLLLAYDHLARMQPRAVAACLSSESFEMLRLVPAGVLRVGVIQSDDPVVYDMARHYAKWVDVMVGVSRTICRKIGEMPEFRETRIEEIAYGIHFGAEPVRAEHDGPLRVVYLGRLDEDQKRISRIAEVINKTAPKKGEAAWVEFTIMGDGRQKNEFLASIASCGHAQFVGEVPNTRVQEILSGQDGFLLLSDFEGLPLSLLETMGSGLVPVVSDLESGLREVVTEDIGLRVPVGDIPAAIAALRSLAENPARRKSLSQAAQRTARTKYSVEQMAEKYLALCPPETRPWPAKVSIPQPFGISSLMFHPRLRFLRRFARRLRPVSKA